MTPDRYQSEVITAIAGGTGHLIVDAKAGSGKTTTILEGLRVLEERTPLARCALSAFNRAIAEELRARLPEDTTTEAFTFNALGHRILGRNSGKRFRIQRRVRVNKWKTRNLTEDTVPRELARDFSRAVSLAKAHLVTPEDAASAAADISAQLGYLPHEEFAILLARELGPTLERSLEHTLATGEIDFDDQIYLPIILRLPFPKKTHLFVDEAQDTSPGQLAFLRRMLTASGRFIAVGDTRQAIYAFRGADHTAIDSIEAALGGATRLPMNVCYRCPTSVIEEARRIVPELEPAPGAPAGIVRTEADVPHDLDLILCRNNAPLFALASRWLRAAQPFCMAKTAFLDAFLRRTIEAKDLNLRENTPFPAARRRIREHLEALIDAANSQRGSLEDILESFEALAGASNAATVGDFRDFFTRLFMGTQGPLLSTIHRAKGTEAPRVGLLYPQLIPSPHARSEAARIQEFNLLYVAITRAQRELVYITGEPQ